MESSEARASGYWYGDDPQVRTGVDALNALRRYRAAESAMRRRTRSMLRLNETDMRAMRFIVSAERDTRAVSPKDLAVHLGISSASTTVLIDRLVASGHISRARHPSDGRGVVLTATATAHTDIRATFGDLHTRMMAVARRLDPNEAAIVTSFLEQMADVVSQEDK
jgi:DNA-binding MarR family transcriptional regulator